MILVTPELLNAVIQTESGGDPKAISPKGARGLMQIMPATARNPGFGLEPLNQRQLPDPPANVQFGAQYLNALLSRYDGDQDAGLVAYNAGPAVADRWVASGKKAPLPAETQGYLQKVSATMKAYQRAPEIDLTADDLLRPGRPQSAQGDVGLTAEDLLRPRSSRQELRAAPSGPLPMRPVGDDVNQGAGFFTTMRASLAPNVEDQIKRFAAARFPDVPLSEAVKRYGVLDGEIVYADERGNIAREVPSIAGGSGVLDTFRRVGQQAAAAVGPGKVGNPAPRNVAGPP